MNFQNENTEEILDKYICGFRCYSLSEQPYLTFVSQNLCDMLEIEKDVLCGDKSDNYAAFVHTSDILAYRKLLEDAKNGAQSTQAEYRLIKKDGSIIYVSDRMSCEKKSDGSLIGYSVLTDITSLKKENEALGVLKDTVPFGVVRFTCEKLPKITYCNDEVLKMMRFPDIKDGELDYFEMYKENIYLAVPMEDRRRFSHFLNQVCGGASMTGEIPILRCDGTKGIVYGWVSKLLNDEGREEFRCVCIDVTESYREQRLTYTERYIKALSEVYDKIFEFDFLNRTLRYIHGNRSDTFGRIQNIPMHLEEATEMWISKTVVLQDRARLKDFFDESFRRQSFAEDSRPPQIQYMAVSSSGEVKKYGGIFLKVSNTVSLFCCKCLQAEQEADKLRSENLSLKNMRDMVMRFTEGVIAFEVENDCVKPLYSSDNIRNFFGYTKDDWLAMGEKAPTVSVKEFISRSGIDYKDIKKLFSSGEAEFTYFDMSQNKNRTIKAICSRKNSDQSEEHEPFYVMLYNLDVTRDSENESSSVYIRTFGYFDVFINDKPIAFRNKKAKELLALLVDRRGGYVTSEEAIGYLWEDEPTSAVTLARYRKEALRLKNTLEEYGIADIIESVDGKRRIIPERVKCDLYCYLSGKEEYAGLFKGSYLTNYAWGETTLGELTNEGIN